MKLTKVTFTELHEAEGTFGKEYAVVAGGGFNKHLIYSYNLKTKTVVFPPEWNIGKGDERISKKGRHDDSVYQFRFGDFCHTVLKREYVKKIDFVEVSNYNPDEFQPNKELVMLTLRVPRRNKARTDKLIKKYQTAKMIVAERSRESRMVISEIGRKEKSLPQYLYELVIQKSRWRDFAKELHEENLVPKTDRFAILMDGAIFPRQLAYFKKAK